MCIHSCNYHPARDIKPSHWYFSPYNKEVCVSLFVRNPENRGSTAGFLNLSTFDISAQIILVCSRVFRSSPGFSSIWCQEYFSSHDNQKCLQMWLNVPWRATVASCLRTAAIENSSTAFSCIFLMPMRSTKCSSNLNTEKDRISQLQWRGLGPCNKILSSCDVCHFQPGH